MKKPLSLFGAAIISLALAGCNPSSEEASEASHDDHNHGPNGEHEVAASPSAEGDSAKTASAYPIDVCLVSGEKLGSMGDPVELTEAGTTVKLCCKECVDTFKGDTAKYLTKLTEATKAAVPTPPMPE